MSYQEKLKLMEKPTRHDICKAMKELFGHIYF